MTYAKESPNTLEKGAIDVPPVLMLPKSEGTSEFQHLFLKGARGD
jgi:hypothetical protein